MDSAPLPKGLYYETYGPFEAKRDGDDIDANAFPLLWEQVYSAHPKLQDAVGVYIFAVRENGNAKPWYVGQTSKLSFQKRLSQHRLRFHDVLKAAGRDGQLEILLIAAKVPASNRFRRPTKTKIEHNLWLESAMIGAALHANKSLINASGRSRHEMRVPGFLNTSKETEGPSAGALRALLAGTI